MPDGRRETVLWLSPLYVRRYVGGGVRVPDPLRGLPISKVRERDGNGFVPIFENSTRFVWNAILFAVFIKE